MKRENLSDLSVSVNTATVFVPVTNILHVCSHFPHYMELYEHKYAKIEFQHRCHQSGCRHRAVNINLQVKSEAQ